MLNRIIAAFSRPKITPILLKRPTHSKYPVVILCQSSMRTERSAMVFGRLA